MVTSIGRRLSSMALALRATEKLNSMNEEDELKKKGYLLGSSLGEGSYAKVRSAFSEKLQRKVAIKVINRKKAPKEFQTRFLPRELDIMRLIKHPNIVQLYEIMHFQGKVYISMEIAGHGDLLEYIRLRAAIPEDKARVMFKQVVDAIEYMHGMNIVHRDLKCENILLDVRNNIKVSDFGFARRLGSMDLSKTFCGSAAYAAPEILQGIPYNGAAYDMWSMGVILYIMVCGSMPYDDSNIKKMIRHQTERKVGFSRSKSISLDCRQLIHSMLEAEVSVRATVAQVQESTWLQKLPLFRPETIEQLQCAPHAKVPTIVAADRRCPQLDHVNKDDGVSVVPAARPTKRQPPGIATPPIGGRQTPDSSSSHPHTGSASFARPTSPQRKEDVPGSLLLSPTPTHDPARAGEEFGTVIDNGTGSSHRTLPQTYSHRDSDT